MVKIGIIGVGTVGGAIAAAIVNGGSPARELVLLDIDAKRVRAAAEDLSHAAAFRDAPIKIFAGGYKDFADADIIVLSAGANQKPGQTRAELAPQNARVIADVVKKIPLSKNIILIVVSNPLDSMVALAQRLSKLPPERVIGTGTMLDTARLRAILSAKFDVSPRAVEAYVLGEHGDSGFVNWTNATLGGLPLPRLSGGEKKKIERDVLGAAYRIIDGRSATWDGIAAATADLIKCIANDERRILPVSIACKGVAYSMPRIVGAKGAIAAPFPAMSAAEKARLSASIRAIEKNLKTIS